MALAGDRLRRTGPPTRTPSTFWPGSAALNFKPGSEWQYSNSGFFLLSHHREAGERAVAPATSPRAASSGRSGMTHTHIHDDHTMVVPEPRHRLHRRATAAGLPDRDVGLGADRRRLGAHHGGGPGQVGRELLLRSGGRSERAGRDGEARASSRAGRCWTTPRASSWASIADSRSWSTAARGPATGPS